MSLTPASAMVGTSGTGSRYQGRDTQRPGAPRACDLIRYRLPPSGTWVPRHGEPSILQGGHHLVCLRIIERTERWTHNAPGGFL